MTTEHQATRTLVKSPPELWAECSDAGSLARHIGEFGEIRITRLDPETSVAWEGEHASGTVRIEPAGWGTRVTLTAQTSGDEAAPEVQAAIIDEAPESPITGVEEETDAKVEETTTEPDPAVAAAAAPARGRWKRLIGRTREWFSPSIEPASESIEDSEAPSPEPAPDLQEAPQPVEVEAEIGELHDSLDPDAILSAALESLGQAHHRPFSRA
jgi:hypothetical protein